MSGANVMERYSVYDWSAYLYCNLNKLYSKREEHIELCILIEVYKCFNQISLPYLHDMFKIRELHYELRNDSLIALPRYNFIKYVKYSMLYEGATLWNALDKKFVHAQSLADLKKLLHLRNGVTCSCMVCKSCCLNNM